MKFWDTSAVVPLLVQQAKTQTSEKLLREDRLMIVSWTTECEAFSALARLERESALSSKAFLGAKAILDTLAQSWNVVEPSAELIVETKRVLRLHPLRSADALQLASAILACKKTPHNLTFLTFNERLSEAAGKEGFLGNID